MSSVLSRLRGQMSRHDVAPTFNGQPFLSAPQVNTSMAGSTREAAPAGFSDMVGKAGATPVVSAAVTVRALMMSQLRFKWLDVRDVEGGRTFGTEALSPLERPGPVTRSGLLTRLEHDASYAGNAYVRLLDDGTLRRLRPDWVEIVLGSDEEPDDVAVGADVQVVGFAYYPGGRANLRGRPMLLGPSEVAHWAPEPDPVASFRGLSWVTSVWRDLAADGLATEHVTRYLENSATANMIIRTPEGLGEDEFKKFKSDFDAGHTGSRNAWKNIFLTHGTDVQVVGAQLADLQIQTMQGGFETRVAARSRVPATILGIREGLAGSALNSGNYGQTRRLWADSWFTPYAEGLCASLEVLLNRPQNAELTFDPSRIMFLQEDLKDRADIQSVQAAAIRTLTDAGFMWDTAVDAVLSDDMSKLDHTGLFSVQLQAPGTQEVPAERMSRLVRDDAGRVVGLAG